METRSRRRPRSVIRRVTLAVSLALATAVAPSPSGASGLAPGDLADEVSQETPVDRDVPESLLELESQLNEVRTQLGLEEAQLWVGDPIAVNQEFVDEIVARVEEIEEDGSGSGGDGPGYAFTLLVVVLALGIGSVVGWKFGTGRSDDGSGVAEVPQGSGTDDGEDRRALIDGSVRLRDLQETGPLRDRLGEVLDEVGVEQVVAESGERFDPDRHRAVARTEGSPAQHNTVSATEHVGYRDNGHMIRPVEVTVYWNGGGVDGA